MLISLASAPSYTTLLAGVNPAQTGKITSALSDRRGQLPAPEQRHRGRGRERSAGAGARHTRHRGAAQLRRAVEPAQHQLGLEPRPEPVPAAADGDGEQEQQLEQRRSSRSKGSRRPQVQLAIPSQTDQLFSSSQSTPSASVLIERLGAARLGLGPGHRQPRRQCRHRTQRQQGDDHRPERATAVAVLQRRRAADCSPSRTPRTRTTRRRRTRSTRCSPRRSAPARPSSRSTPT